MDQANSESKKNVQQKRYIQWIINIVLVAAVAALWIVYLTTRTAIGYVDNAQLLNKSAMVQQAQAEIQVKIDEFRQEITKQEQEILLLREVLDKSEDKATIERELDERITAYESYVQEVQNELAQLESEKMTPVFDTINDAIDDFGRKRRYNLILGATASGNVVFGDSRVNITDDLVDYVNGLEVPEVPQTEE